MQALPLPCRLEFNNIPKYMLYLYLLIFKFGSDFIASKFKISTLCTS